MNKHLRKCNSRDSNPGNIDGNDIFYHETTDAVSFVHRRHMIHGRGKHRSRKGAFGRPWGPGKQASARITFESPIAKESSPGVEPGLSRP
jgi:hypothetical protein